MRQKQRILTIEKVYSLPKHDNAWALEVIRRASADGDRYRCDTHDQPWSRKCSENRPLCFAALVYQFNGEHGFSLVQYNFLPSDALYNITIMAPDEDGTFYAGQQENWTSLYGEPLTEAGADLHWDDDPVAVMMAALMQNSADSDFLGWRADDETVIIMSREPANKVCYVEIRRYTDYFRFE